MATKKKKEEQLEEEIFLSDHEKDVVDELNNIAVSQKVRIADLVLEVLQIANENASLEKAFSDKMTAFSEARGLDRSKYWLDLSSYSFKLKDPK